jgi:hypothetical protein
LPGGVWEGATDVMYIALLPFGLAEIAKIQRHSKSIGIGQENLYVRYW